MFVGHYGVSFAFKSFEKPLPLWLLFIAVQFVDVLWAVFVPLGIERVRITPGITASNPLDLYYMPYSHSLVAALLWSGAAFVAYKLTRRRAAYAAFLVAAAVFSHWVLDLIVHRPDLPLYDDTYKMGFGVWNYPAVAFALEAGLLFGGMFLYLRSTSASSNRKVWNASFRYHPPGRSSSSLLRFTTFLACRSSIDYHFVLCCICRACLLARKEEAIILKVFLNDER